MKTTIDECEACTYAAEHGHWGKAIPTGHTHCPQCHATMPMSNRWGHCTRCHQTFAGTSAFDAHQRVDADGNITPECMCSSLATRTDPESILARIRKLSWQISKSVRLVKHENTWGTYWARDSDGENPWKSGVLKR